MSHKWTKADRSVAVGGVVYLTEAENDDPTRLGVVEKVKPCEDGCLRTVKIQYTNPGKEQGKRSPPKVTTRPIHKITMIAPAENVMRMTWAVTRLGSAGPASACCQEEARQAPEEAGSWP